MNKISDTNIHWSVIFVKVVSSKRGRVGVQMMMMMMMMIGVGQDEAAPPYYS
jgi:hypothetical protein